METRDAFLAIASHELKTPLTPLHLKLTSLARAIESETASSLTVRRAEGLSDTILRQDIEEIITTGQSLMPEGLEEKIAPQEMVDLIAYLLRLQTL